MPVYPGAHNAQRPHQALKLQPPEPDGPAATSIGAVHRRDRLGGLIHEYHRAAA